jgi:hypothetical protein
MLSDTEFRSFRVAGEDDVDADDAVLSDDALPDEEEVDDEEDVDEFTAAGELPEEEEEKTSSRWL